MQKPFSNAMHTPKTQSEMLSIGKARAQGTINKKVK